MYEIVYDNSGLCHGDWRGLPVVLHAWPTAARPGRGDGEVAHAQSRRRLSGSAWRVSCRVFCQVQLGREVLKRRLLEGARGHRVRVRARRQPEFLGPACDARQLGQARHGLGELVPLPGDQEDGLLRD